MSPGSLLNQLDPDAVSLKAQAEVKNREVHLPPVSAYRWWARRTLAVSGALVQAAEVHFGQPRLRIGDPFAGGGVIPLAAASRGHTVLASDLNPWAVYGLKALLALPDADTIAAAGARLAKRVAPLLHTAYGSGAATIAHTLRVAVGICTRCGTPARLFPFATVSLLRRRDRGEGRGWLACPRGHLFVGPVDRVQPCPTCTTPTDPAVGYLPRRVVTCSECAHTERLSARGRLGWEVVLVERITGRQRTLDRPTPGEIAQAESPGWRPTHRLGPIEDGPESSVLLRHGMARWSDLYPPRQRAVTEALLALADTEPPPVRAALRLAILGTVEMAGRLSRWDRYYLKSYEAMASHRFNLTTLAAEPNVWGTPISGRGTVTRRLRSLQRAAAWRAGHTGSVTVTRQDARAVGWPAGSLDLILTDPPYHDDVGYDELSRPLRAWAGLPIAGLPGQATGADYEATLAAIFAHLRTRLRPGGHLVFSFANRQPTVWVSLLSALQSAGLFAAGYAIVHSENARDAVKRNGRACTLDLLLDLVTTPPAPFVPAPPPRSDEGAFLQTVGAALLRLGRLNGDWAERLVVQLSAMPFLAEG